MKKQRTKREAGAILYTKWFGHAHFTMARIAGGWRATSKLSSGQTLTLMDDDDVPVEHTIVTAADVPRA